MKKVFENTLLKENLNREIKSWLETPYCHWGNKKGIGADCSLFILKIFQDIGIINDFTIPYRDRVWSKYGTEEVLLQKIEEIRIKYIKMNYYLLQIFEKTFFFGDLLTFSSRDRLTDHMAIYIDKGEIVESTESMGVHVLKLDNRICKLSNYYRFYERIKVWA